MDGPRFSRLVERIGFLSMTVSISVLLFILLVIAENFGILAVLAVASALMVSILSVLFAISRFRS